MTQGAPLRIGRPHTFHYSVQRGAKTGTRGAFRSQWGSLRTRGAVLATMMTRYWPEGRFIHLKGHIDKRMGRRSACGGISY